MLNAAKLLDDIPTPREIRHAITCRKVEIRQLRELLRLAQITDARRGLDVDQEAGAVSR